MSRIRSGIPIYCFTPHPTTQRRAAMFRGVYPLPFDPSAHDPAEVADAAIALLKSTGAVQTGDWVILTKGDLNHNTGGTNTLKIVKVD